MQAVHVLVDLENNQPTLEDVKRLVPDVTHAWLFHSPGQAKRLASFEPLGDRYTAVPISRPGKNALDFHLTFYVGYLAARNPDAKLVVVAIDRGYGPMIEHAVELDLKVAQVAFKPIAKPVGKAAAKKAPAQTAGKKVTAKKAPAKTTATAGAATQTVASKKTATKPGAAGKAKAAKQPAPPAMKTAVAKKTAPSKKTAAAKKPVSAKKARRVSAPSKGVAAAKPTTSQASAKAGPATAAAPAATVKPTAQAKPIGVDKVIVNLRKVAPDRRPKKLKQLRGHLSSLLGADVADGRVTTLLNNLVAANVVRLDGDTVIYGAAVEPAAG